MPARLNLSGNKPAIDSTLTIGDTTYDVSLRWNWRAGDWRISLRRQDTGEYDVVSRRLSPGGEINVPGGVLATYGPDPYDRRALGSTLTVQFYTDAEILESIDLEQQDPTFALVL
jgi:hypothetical protein